MDGGQDKKGYLVGAAPSNQWCLAVDVLVFDVLARFWWGKNVLPDEIEQNESTDSQISADPVDFAFWINRLIRWNSDYGGTEDYKP